jgi:hypothetical protein
MKARGRPFEKGHPRLPGAGRAKGTKNHVAVNIKRLLDRLLPEDELEKLWRHHLYSKDRYIAFRAFELALQYRYGRPGPPDAETTSSDIDMTDIPTLHVPVVLQ